ncbi:MAG: AraC family transcriptional regulator [Puia sp.]|nr:AraC family transcriptional regulator [Puia sp.]
MHYHGSIRLSREELAIVEKAIHHVRDHYQQKFTEQDLAEEFGMTPKKMQTGFRKVTGFTVYKFQLFVRIEMSKEFLRDENLSVKQVAHKAGFSTQSRFGEIFKELTGYTPTDYRVEHFGYKKPFSDN